MKYFFALLLVWLLGCAEKIEKPLIVDTRLQDLYNLEDWDDPEKLSQKWRNKRVRIRCNEIVSVNNMQSGYVATIRDDPKSPIYGLAMLLSGEDQKFKNVPKGSKVFVIGRPKGRTAMKQDIVGNVKSAIELLDCSVEVGPEE